jgi:formylmethanofuran dehydrogenase subunit D
MKLITGRVIEQGALLDNKLSDEYRDVVATCELNKEDMNALRLREGDNVLVKSDFGDVVVKAKRSLSCVCGIAFIPMGPWANAVIDPDTAGCGMPGYKGIDIEIVRTGSPLLGVKEIIEGYK